MGEVIRLAVRFRAARSGDSRARKKSRRASVVPFRLRGCSTRTGSGPAGTTSQHADGADGGLGPLQPAPPRSEKSDLCPEVLAFRDSIMDDKSMQLWSNEQLTSGAEARRIAHVSVGRPKEPVGPAAYRTAFIKRVRAARALYTDSPPEMAIALGVARDTYYRYEQRLMMPHHLIPRFCEVTGVTVQWLIEGPAAARAMNQSHSATGTDSR
jgi:hypothetical protein